ncbi:MAG: hypothetical protein ACI8RA_002922, partial [Chlamydiales bacterium]
FLVTFPPGQVTGERESHKKKPPLEPQKMKLLSLFSGSFLAKVNTSLGVA